MRIGAAAFLIAAAPALGENAAFSTKHLTPETALKAAQAALTKCRDSGYQVAVAVVDRAGITQVMLRDRFAGPHTVDFSQNKAWTAASFKTSTLELAKLTRPDQPMSGLRAVPRFAAIGGGLPVEAGGSLLGGIGVSGAPSGEADDMCAAAGIKAIADSLEF
jgi:uncharacterized protein GlcG (DUF336 family)